MLKNRKNIFITGIGTDVGKTVVSAILCEAWQTDYWKAIQAGDLLQTDSMKIKSLCSEKRIIHPEKFLLKTAASPHFSAQLEQLQIKKEDLYLPATQNHLIVEGAGGLLVPINSLGFCMIDWAKEWLDEVVLVSRHYLGSINHTLLSIDYLLQNTNKKPMVVFVGDENPSTEQIIQTIHPDLIYASIPLTTNVNRKFVKKEAEKMTKLFHATH